jgi:hypothetical protein
MFPNNYFSLQQTTRRKMAESKNKQHKQPVNMVKAKNVKSIAADAKRKKAAAEKMKRQRARLTEEENEALREVDRIRKATKRQHKSSDEKVARINAMKRSRKNELPEKKASRREAGKTAMREARGQLSPEEKTAYREGSRIAMEKTREQQSPEEKESMRRSNAIARKQKRRNKSEEDALRRKRQRRACDAARNQEHEKAQEDKDDDSLSPYIQKAIKQALEKLHWTKNDDDPRLHSSYVCIICDCFIHGTDSVCSLKANEIKAHRQRLSVDAYENYYKTSFPEEFKKQYHVAGFPGLFLSPRSRRYKGGWVTCPLCRSSMRPSNATKTNPPKFAIANGFVIGSFPEKIKTR